MAEVERQQMSKEYIGFISLILVLASTAPYVIAVFRGETKPHLFSWIMWTIPTAIVFAGQAVSSAGPGGWATGLTLICNIFIVIQSLKYAEKNISKNDWFFLIAGLAAIPLWMMTKEPLYSVILVTITDICGYGPTVRKSWKAPYEENALAYFLLLPKHIASLLAMESFSAVNILFPIAMIIVNGALVGFLLLRRKQLAQIS